MGNAEKIDIEIFKAVTRAIAQSDDLEIMTLSLIHISEPTRPPVASRMPSSA